jgi:hypothetical protein
MEYVEFIPSILIYMKYMKSFFDPYIYVSTNHSDTLKSCNVCKWKVVLQQDFLGIKPQLRECMAFCIFSLYLWVKGTIC